MTRYSASLLSVLVALWAAHASAQDAGVVTTSGTGAVSGGSTSGTGNSGNLGVQILEAGKREYEDRISNTVPINAAACAQGTMRVQIQRLPPSSQYPYMEAWYGAGGGACQQGNRSTRPAGTGNCVKLDIETGAEMIMSRTFYDFEVNIQPVCSSGEGKRSIFFLALSGQNSNEDAAYYAELVFNVDLTAPAVVQNVASSPGETEIPLSWTPPDTSQYFWVLVDINAGPGGNDDDAGSNPLCNSSLIRAGAPFDPSAVGALDNLPDGVIYKYFQGRTSETTFNSDDWGDSMLGAATVIAADKAFNPSVMSEVVCLNAVKTSGFWDRYRENGGTAEPGCACSVPGAGARSRGLNVTTGLPVLGLLAFGFTRWRRIRRRAR